MASVALDYEQLSDIELAALVVRRDASAVRLITRRNNQRLYRTADRGEHWEPISPDLTRENPGVPANLDAVTAADNQGQGPRRGVIYAIAPSPAADGVIWTGTDDGLIWRTRDSGVHWDNVTPKDLTAWSKVGTAAAIGHPLAAANAQSDQRK